MRRRSRRPTFAAATVIDEVVANARASRWVTTSSVVISAAIAASVCMATYLDVSRIVGRNNELDARGLSVLVVSAEDRAFISGARCDELNSISGVRAAGGLSTTHSVAASVGSVPISVLSATSRLPEVMWPTSTTGGASVIAGSETASILGLVDRSGANIIDPVDGSTRLNIDKIAMPSSRDEHFDDSIVVLQPPQTPIVQCYVDAEPGARRDVERLLVGWFGGQSRTFISPFYVDSSAGGTPQQELETRLTGAVPVVAAALLSILALVQWLGRRSEFALYRLLGLPPSKLALMLVTEYAMLCLAPACAGALAAEFVIAPSVESSVASIVGLDLVTFLAATLIIPALGLLLVRRFGTIESLKGR